MTKVFNMVREPVAQKIISLPWTGGDQAAAVPLGGTKAALGEGEYY